MNKTGNEEITFYRATGGEKRKHLNEEILKLFPFINNLRAKNSVPV